MILIFFPITWKEKLKEKNNMKNIIKVGVGLSLLFTPFLTFAATDDQIQASLTQQLLSMFVVEVNALDKMQSLVAQSSNPSQFNNFSGLVASQLSETTAQLATLLNAPGGIPVNMTSPVGTSVSPIETCIPNPVLTLTATPSVISSGGQMVTLSGSYSTGCDLDTNTPWVFKDTDWNKTGAVKDYDLGTLNPTRVPWSMQGPTPGQAIYTVGYFSSNAIYYNSETFTLTVGNTTATTTVTVQ